MLRELFSSRVEKVLLSRVWASHPHRGGFSCLDHRLWGTWASGVGIHGLSIAGPGLKITDSIVVAHRLTCCTACLILLDQGLNPWLQVNSLPLNHQGSPVEIFLVIFLSFHSKAPTVQDQSKLDMIQMFKLFFGRLRFMLPNS